MKVNEVTLSATELGQVLGISGRRVAQLAADGVFERAGRGQFPLCACVRAYIAETKSNSESDDLQRERLALLRARRRRLELTNERIEGSSHQIDAQAACVNVFATLLFLRLRDLAAWTYRFMHERDDLAHAAVELGGTVNGWLIGARAECEKEIAAALLKARAQGVLIADYNELLRLMGRSVVVDEGDPEPVAEQHGANGAAQ